MPSFPTTQILIAIAASAIISLLSVRSGLLSVSGGPAAFLLGTVMLGLGGLSGGLPLIAFFLPSSLLSHVGPWRKRKMEGLYQKGSRRDAWQVAANGGVAGLLMIVIWLLPQHELYLPLVASLAAAAADTWGTEIGGGIGGRTVSIATWRSVEPGTSGGISLIGTAGGLAGALVVGLSALPWFDKPIRDLAIVTTAALCGMLLDSLIGATMQRRFRCPRCGVITERSTHCDTPALHYAGVRFIDNDGVNLICATSAALVALIIS